MKVVSFKADENDIHRWKEEAHNSRITMGEWIRRKLNGGVPAAPALVSLARPKEAKCEHRLPPGAYCKRCQKLKK
jgi:hypothetical protein